MQQQRIDFKNELVGGIDKQIQEGRDPNIPHVSDTVLCPRQGVFRVLNPGSPYPKQMRNWVLCGKQIHTAAQNLLNPERFEVEKEVKTASGIVGHVDIYIKDENKPVEYKTTRSARKNLPKSFHKEQLKRYMAMLNSPDGVLFYQLINDFSEDPFLQYDIHTNEQEKREVLKNMEYDRIEREEAIKKKDPSIARAIRYNKELNWLCSDCPFNVACEKMYIDERA